MDDGKFVYFEGKRVPVSQIKHWKFDEQLDLKENSPLNAKRWECFQTVLRAWNTLDASLFDGILSSSFTYTSAWVRETMKGAANYRKYITGKFNAMRNGKSQIHVEVVTIREALHPQFYSYALLIHQNEDIHVILSFAFKEDQIDGMSMAEPEIYTYERHVRI